MATHLKIKESCVTDHSSGHAEEWESLTPTRGARPKRGKTLSAAPGTPTYSQRPNTLLGPAMSLSSIAPKRDQLLSVPTVHNPVAVANDTMPSLALQLLFDHCGWSQQRKLGLENWILQLLGLEPATPKSLGKDPNPAPNGQTAKRGEKHTKKA